MTISIQLNMEGKQNKKGNKEPITLRKYLLCCVYMCFILSIFDFPYQFVFLVTMFLVTMEICESEAIELLGQCTSGIIFINNILISRELHAASSQQKPWVGQPDLLTYQHHINLYFTIIYNTVLTFNIKLLKMG